MLGSGRRQMDSASFKFDPDFEFSAPHFYDFTAPETLSEVADAERWFETSASHGASPLSIRSRDLTLTPNRLDDGYDGEQMDVSSSPQKGGEDTLNASIYASEAGQRLDIHDGRIEVGRSSDFEVNPPSPPQHLKTRPFRGSPKLISPSSLPVKRAHTEMSKKAPMTDKPAPKSRNSKFSRPTQNLSLRDNHGEKVGRHEAQAIKKQKLEGGRLKQIMSVNDEKSASRTPAPLTVPKAFNFQTEKRLMSAYKPDRPVSPFVSMAEKVQRFQSKPRDFLQDRVLNNEDCCNHLQEKLRLKLTRPKEPELETSQRVRPARVKSTAELEAEILAKMPKFKARPLNKKILEAPTLPPLPKSTPLMPDFQEFHLRTMDRALQHGSTSSVSSVDSGMVEECRYRRKSAPVGAILEPREPHLETAARARPPKVKSSEEREQEELAKIPKFKARPLDKKIFWSRGDLGIFRNTKRQVTTPVEFHFATEERINSQHHLPLDLFSKLSLNSQQENQPPKQTKLEPFHFLTEDRGQKKEQRMLMELSENEIKEHEQRIPKANPLPCTTDYREVPMKPDPKACTIPQPFCLESFRRHQEEMLRMAEENRRIEKEEKERRKFHAQPITCVGPVFVPERSRKPLTEVQEFALQVDSRAMERAEFDRKVAEKQNNYKRFREEFEAARKADEERLIKSLRRTMVPQALPLPVFEKPFVPRRCSKELTRPRSPKLSVLHRRERRSSLTFRRQSMTFSIQKRLQMR